MRREILNQIVEVMRLRNILFYIKNTCVCLQAKEKEAMERENGTSKMDSR